MVESSSGPTTVAGARIGRTDLGQATVTLDDDALTLGIREARGDRAIRVELAMVDRVSSDAGELTLTIRGGTQLTLTSDSPGELGDAILARCRVLPELTSALRAFGSRRGRIGMRGSAADEQREFFAPLLRARRAAGESDSPATIIAAFDVDVLGLAMRGAVIAFAEQRCGQTGAARRALEAELLDAVEPLDAALDVLRTVAASAVNGGDELNSWREWAARLRTTFEIADHVWAALDAVLDAHTPPPPRPTSSRSRRA